MNDGIVHVGYGRERDARGGVIGLDLESGAVVGAQALDFKIQPMLATDGTRLYLRAGDPTARLVRRAPRTGATCPGCP